MSRLKLFAALAILAVLLAACVSVPAPAQPTQAPAQPPTAVPQAAAKPTAEPAKTDGCTSARRDGDDHRGDHQHLHRHDPAAAGEHRHARLALYLAGEPGARHAVRRQPAARPEGLAAAHPDQLRRERSEDAAARRSDHVHHPGGCLPADVGSGGQSIHLEHHLQDLHVDDRAPIAAAYLWSARPAAGKDRWLQRPGRSDRPGQERSRKRQPQRLSLRRALGCRMPTR